MHVLDILTIFCAVAMTGTEFTVAMILNPAFDHLDRATWLKTMPVLARVMGRAMPVWYGLGFLFIGIEGYFRFHAPSRGWLIAAIVLWAAGILYSVTMLVPINNRIAAAEAGSEASLPSEHKRWDVLHRWRVALLVVATLCLLLGIG